MIKKINDKILSLKNKTNGIWKLSSKAIEPNNLDILKDELKDYVNSGKYYKDITTELEIAANYLDTERTDKSCIVIDIDETLISEYQFMLANDFAWTSEIIDEAQTITTFPAFEQTMSFYQWCLAQGIPVYILSSRRIKNMVPTIELLQNAGYNNYTKLILRPDDDKQTIAQFKYNERGKLMAQGLEILCNIGDQISDLVMKENVSNGENAIHSIKIPNPFYYISCEVT